MTDARKPKFIGTVFLVGAGPGDPGLLTRAGAQALSSADVVVYDRLGSAALLTLARSDANMVYVGKAAAQHSVPQHEINLLLVDYAQQGLTVCRLKGGDPFVFGRGGEEAACLQEHGIPYVVIPGVTSAIAVPAYAGIPVTDRSCASSFAVITGHEDPTKAQSSIDWAGIAHGADTLVFLMGLANLAQITEQLQVHGRVATTPVAAIQEGTTPQQRVVTGTLENITSKVAEAGLQSPVITIVGEVVKLRQTLCWFETRPLFGKRVLVTRSREQASALSQQLVAAGAEAVELPLVRFETLPAVEKLLPRLQQADWLVFTSVNALPALLQQLTSLGHDIRALGKASIAAVGESTAESLRQRGLQVDFVPDNYLGEAVAREFPDPEGQHIVIPRALEGSETLPEILIARGAIIDDIPVYSTLPVTGDLLDLSSMDIITFTSSSTVRHFRTLYPGEIHGPRIACIGPATAATAKELGLPVDIMAETSTIPGLVKALVAYYR